MQFKVIYFILSFFLLPGWANAQYTDSLTIQVGSLSTFAVGDYQPHWLVSNRYGSIADRQNDLSTHFRIRNRQGFIDWKEASYFLVKPNPEEEVYLEYGVDFFTNNHFQDFVFRESFFKVGYKTWGVRIGRFKEVIGEMDPDLSSGSLGISGNALPIPKAQFIVNDYTNLPFSKGWLQFKGQFSHGWLGKKRFMKDAFLHEKTFYMRFGKHQLKLFGGVQHFAVWGGRRTDWIQTDRSLDGLWDVVLVREANDGSDKNTRVIDSPGEQKAPDNSVSKKPGDHRGVVEGGLEWENANLRLKVYHQTPIEVRHGITLKNIDKLFGITLSSKHSNNFLQKVVFEGIHTHQMNDFVPLNYRDSYYNNDVYKTGWEYRDRIIGTPLFVNSMRGAHYFPQISPFDWDAPYNTRQGHPNVINSRILGGHFGLSLLPSPRIQTRTLLTYTRNFGTFDEHGPFAPSKKQFYGLQEVVWQIPYSGWRFKGGVGMDIGEFSQNFGFMAGFELTLFGKEKVYKRRKFY